MHIPLPTRNREAASFIYLFICRRRKMAMKKQTETMQRILSKSRRFTHIFLLPEVKRNLQSFHIFCLISFIIFSPACCSPYLAFSSSVRRHPKSRVFLLLQPGFSISWAAPNQSEEHLRPAEDQVLQRLGDFFTAFLLKL